MGPMTRRHLTSVGLLVLAPSIPLALALTSCSDSKSSPDPVLTTLGGASAGGSTGQGTPGGTPGSGGVFGASGSGVGTSGTGFVTGGGGGGQGGGGRTAGAGAAGPRASKAGAGGGVPQGRRLTPHGRA